MNRLVLIGNGFDLAHGLKTSYADFIDWYWEQWKLRLLCSDQKNESDGLCSFKLKDSVGLHGWYLVWGSHYKRINTQIKWKDMDVVDIARNDKDLCDFEYNSSFFQRINQSIETKGWVDIENEYYNDLINCSKHCDGEKKVITINEELDYLKKKLVEYLTSEEQKKCNLIEDIRNKMYRPIKKEEIALSYDIQNDFLSPDNVLMLNFNYTNTPQKYIRDNSNINYIHGWLSSPKSVIFGYGDELDDNYIKLQNLNDNEYLKYIKSIRYLEHENYRIVLRFIESAPFQVCIMGHSCGNSDRTLLNTIFEHKNCISIKPYYYIKDDGTDNYIELVQNISRNFKDMKLMRDRVVNKMYCEPLSGEKPESESLDSYLIIGG